MVLLTCSLAHLAVFPVAAQSGYVAEGDEYVIAGALPGDQVFPDVSVKSGGGIVVWQDNFTDGDGLGISARRLDGSFSGSLSTFRVNQQGAFDQERPRVTMLNDGGAVFVWQGGRQGHQRIYARFLSASNTWVTGDILVNSFTNQFQLTPRVATLANGEVVVVWSSFGQLGPDSYQDVFAQRFTAAGQKLGGEFRANEFVAHNQRLPAIAPLADGRFAVVWVTEGQRFEESVDICGRLFGPTGIPTGSEFVINISSNLCAHPSIAGQADGGFLVAWSQRDLANRSNSWDVVSRPFSAAGAGGVERFVNSHRYGDQLAPQVSVGDTGNLVIWTSYGQDGSREGVYGRFVQGDGSPLGGEFRVNTTTASQQIHPVLAADGEGRFLVVWTSFVGGAASFDLYAQRYAALTQPLSPPDPPFVSVLGSNALSVAWPALAGYSVAHYEVYADGAATPTATVTNHWWTMSGLAPASVHYFQLAYVLADGRRSPLSGATTNTTFGPLVYGGIPYDWMVAHFGGDVFNWPSPLADSDGDGVNNRNEFLAGTDPTDPDSVLRIRLHRTPQGLFLSWNTQPGLMYQVQASSNMNGWSHLGGPRFAAGHLDSMYVGGANAGYYRVLRLR